ncbi:MAG TPA: biotin synthase BioB [Candidatus Hypogeohydataceae bacterium YC41]
MNASLKELGEKVLSGGQVNREEAFLLLSLKGESLHDLFYWANAIRHHYKGNEITCCAIMSAKRGKCPEDCKFCAQSLWYETGVEDIPLVREETFRENALGAVASRASALGMVTSGKRLSHGELVSLCRAIRAVSNTTSIHASLGLLTNEAAKLLKLSGVKRYNHNLETSRRFFPKLCTTHTYEDRLTTISVAKEAGMEICSGGIFGVGESPEDRLDVAFTLRELEVDTVPLNFLHSIPGTPLEANHNLSPIDILKIIAIFRFILPANEIKVAGGRQKNLRSMQSWIFYAGASSIIVGDYLTTKGSPPEEDFQMIADLGLKVRNFHGIQQKTSSK